jgi:hypothetical protein
LPTWPANIRISGRRADRFPAIGKFACWLVGEMLGWRLFDGKHGPPMRHFAEG